MMPRPITTLFMLMSVDGKISTGNSDALDVDQDFPKMDGVKEGLYQYYEIEACSELYSFNTGRVMQKIGVNTHEDEPKSMPVSFILIDNKPHINENGILYLCKWLKQVIIFTNNKNHPGFYIQEDNLFMHYQEKVNLHQILEIAKKEYSVERMMIQSGGNLNGLFLREKLIDYVDVVMAPILIGGKDTSSLIDGDSIIEKSQLNELGVLQLEHCDVLKDSYIRLRYKVIK